MQLNLEDYISEVAIPSLFEKKNCMVLLDRLTEVIAVELDHVFSGSEQRIVLEETDQFELVLCTWYPESARQWHTHPQTKCYFKCIKGYLREHRESTESLIKAGDHSYIDDSLGGHRVSLCGNSPAASVHLYIKE